MSDAGCTVNAPLPSAETRYLTTGLEGGISGRFIVSKKETPGWTPGLLPFKKEMMPCRG